MSDISDRFQTAFNAAIEQHPAKTLSIAAAHEDFNIKARSMWWDADKLDDEFYTAQVAQAVDRAAIKAGLTEKRHFAVDLGAASNRHTQSVALTMIAHRKAVRVGLSNGLQVARFAAGIDETLRMANQAFPTLRQDKPQQKASQIMFKEGMNLMIGNNTVLKEIDDTALLEICSSVFKINTQKIRRRIGN